MEPETAPDLTARLRCRSEPADALDLNVDLIVQQPGRDLPSQFPELALETGDRLYVPPRPSTVGVFGSVFNAGSYLFSAGRGVTDYLRLAGGPTRGADDRSVFVVRANGSVVSSLQSGSWFNRGGDLKSMQAVPGDTIFVPEEMNKTTTLQNVRD